VIERSNGLTREHWTQVAVIITPVLIALIGGIWFLSADIESVRQSSTIAVAVVSAKQAGQEERINSLEKIGADHYTAQLAAQLALQSTLTAAVNSLADLRVTVGARKDGSK
jgi:hypothetical protein